MPDDSYVGSTLEHRYKVESILGEDSMGLLYRCRHKVIGKNVALKILRPEHTRDRAVVDRFFAELKTVNSLGSSRIIAISDWGQLPDGAIYVAMELLEGESLSHLVDGGKAIDLPRAIAIGRQIAEGLSDAHNEGVFHGAIRPSSIFLARNGGEGVAAKLLDFGIYGLTTACGVFFGKPHYISPEQAERKFVDHHTDIYSLGVVLYQMASGRVPFDAGDFNEICREHISTDPLPIRSIVPPVVPVPIGLEAIILKCLEKFPAQRYRSMDDLLSDLEKAYDSPVALGEMRARLDRADGKLPLQLPKRKESVHSSDLFAQTTQASKDPETGNTGAIRRSVVEDVQFTLPSARPKNLLRRVAEALNPPARSSDPASKTASSTVAAYHGDEPYIFISYSRSDTDLITPFLRALAEQNHRFWYDAGIHGSTEWAEVIEAKLDRCRLFLVFLSRNSVDSKWVRREISRADSLNKPLLPVMIEPVELTQGTGLLLGATQIVNLANRDFIEEVRKAWSTK